MWLILPYALDVHFWWFIFSPLTNLKKNQGMYDKQEKLWDSREEAMEEFLTAMAACEGSEGSRYAKIYSELAAGKAVCTD